MSDGVVAVVGEKGVQGREGGRELAERKEAEADCELCAGWCL